MTLNFIYLESLRLRVRGSGIHVGFSTNRKVMAVSLDQLEI